MDDPAQHHGPAGMGTANEDGAVVRLVLVLGAVLLLGSVFGAFTTIAVVAALIVIIFLHEMGHYLTARWSGMKVTEFFLGFGPRLWSVRREGVEYGVKAIPAGAYVRIVGMNNLEEVDPADEPHTYRQQSFPKRVLVAGAGSAVHFLLAFLLLVVLIGGFGTRSVDNYVIGAVGSEGETSPSPAAAAGMQVGDVVVAVDGAPIGDWTQLREEMRDRPGETVVLTVERDSRVLDLTVELEAVTDTETGDEFGRLGVAADFPPQPDRSPGALLEAGEVFVDISRESVGALVGFFSPSNLSSYASLLSGSDEPTSDATATSNDEGENRFLSPVGFVRIAGQAAETGMAQVVQLLVLINIFVGIFNLVPLLPFDGGHIALAVYERVRSIGGERYHADVAKLLPLTYVVVLLLGFIGVSALYLDVSQPLDNPFQ